MDRARAAGAAGGAVAAVKRTSSRVAEARGWAGDKWQVTASVIFFSYGKDFCKNAHRARFNG